MDSIPILYVEDEDADVVLLQYVLGKVGIHNPLQTVKDGRLAKDYLAGKEPFEDRRRHPLPSLVLLDLNLPYWSGFEVLKWIRQQPQLRRLPVVVLSSSNRPDDIARAYDAGANGYRLSFREERMRVPQGRGGAMLRLTVRRDGITPKVET